MGLVIYKRVSLPCSHLSVPATRDQGPVLGWNEAKGGDPRAVGTLGQENEPAGLRGVSSKASIGPAYREMKLLWSEYFSFIWGTN